MNATEKTDLDYRVNEALDTWTHADRAAVQRLAEQAEALARATEQQGREEEWNFLAAQTTFGCDWAWKHEEDEPTARVYDCDGYTIEIFTDES